MLVPAFHCKYHLCSKYHCISHDLLLELVWWMTLEHVFMKFYEHNLLLWSAGSASKLGNGGFRKPWTSMTNPKHQIEVPGFPSIPPKCRCGAAVQLQWEVLCRSLRSALRLSAHCRRQLRKLRCRFASDYIAIHSSHNSHWQITESHLNSWGAVHG